MFVFSSLVNPRLDLDLLPHWIAFYKTCLFDRYIITLHDDGQNLYERNRATALFSMFGWETRTIGGEFQNGELQRSALESVKCLLNADDYFVTADSDEFINMLPHTVRAMAVQYDYIHGMLVDCWGVKATAASGDSLLVEQYPHRGCIYEEAAKKKNVPVACDSSQSNNWEFHLPRTKIFCAKAWLPVNLQGSHLIDGQEKFRGYGPVDILHYSWRKSCIDRMLTKTYIPTWIMASILEMLGEDPTTECGLKLVEKMKADQEQKGWI